MMTIDEQERAINAEAESVFKTWRSPRRPNAIWLMRRDVLNGGQSFQPLNQSKMPDLNGKECLALALRAQGHGIKAIGKRLGICRFMFRNFLVRNGLPLNSGDSRIARPESPAVVSKYSPASKRIESNINRAIRSPAFILKQATRSRMKNATRACGCRMSDTAINLLGCSLSDYEMYLFDLFELGMAWRNFGAWHIDHINPINTFDLSSATEQRKAFHWSNTRPIWAAHNLSRPKDGNDMRVGGGRRAKTPKRLPASG